MVEIRRKRAEKEKINFKTFNQKSTNLTGLTKNENGIDNLCASGIIRCEDKIVFN